VGAVLGGWIYDVLIAKNHPQGGASAQEAA
jgi:hypothetical protein